MIELDNHDYLHDIVIRDYPTYSGLTLKIFPTETDGRRKIPQNGVMVGILICHADFDGARFSSRWLRLPVTDLSPSDMSRT